MKILITIFDINNFGGIAADLELKCKGLKEAGHHVSICMLRNTKIALSVKKTLKAGGPEGSYPSTFSPYKGVPIICNTDYGWYNIPVIGFGSDEGIAKWKSIANRYDVIFHEIPGPNPPDKDGRWRQIYDVKPPQIIIAHDAHFRVMYPHIIDVAKKVKGIACTNPAGYIGLEWFPGYRAFIGAPHPMLDWDSMPTWEQRKPVGVAAHMWKAWKHQDRIIRAIPYLKKSKMIMAGDGIERHYMQSKTKCPKEFVGIWAAAEQSRNMSYKGLVPPDQLFKMYQRSRVMVDLSFSHTFNDLGNHFNRSIIEGYNNGVVPICVDMNMKDDNTQRRLFKAGKTHIEISHTAKPKEIAELIDHTAHMHADDAMQIITYGRKILSRFFDYRRSSLDFLKLAEQEPCGVYPELEHGKLNRHIKLTRDMKLAGKPTPTIKAALKKSERESSRS